MHGRDRVVAEWICYPTTHGNCPIHDACRNGHPEIVSMLRAWEGEGDLKVTYYKKQNLNSSEESSDDDSEYEGIYPMIRLLNNENGHIEIVHMLLAGGG